MRDGRSFVLRVNVWLGPERMGREVGLLVRSHWRVVVGGDIMGSGRGGGFEGWLTLRGLCWVFSI